MGSKFWIGSVSTLTLLGLPSLAIAQTTAPQGHNAQLEERIAQLEAELNSLKAEIRSGQTAPIAEPRPPAVALPAPLPHTSPAPLPASQSTIDRPEPEGFRIGDHRVKFGGFIKVDASVSRFSHGNPDSADLGRNFYLPSSIPVAGEREDAITDFTARQTRFWITSEREVGGHQVGTRLEMDFQALPGSGDNRTTNPSNPALRRAFITVDNWLLGQEWSNFSNPDAMPDTADYVGVTDGAVVVRQPQVRYSQGGWAFSVENPDTTLSPYLAGARIVADDNSLPDLTLSYGVNRPWGQARLAGLVRQLKYVDRDSQVDTSATGWGLSASALLKVGERDDIRLMVTGGEGIGRYIGLNFGNDAVLNRHDEMEPLGVISGFAAYRHFWNPDLRSNLIVSGERIDNPADLTGQLVNRSASSVRGNLIWSPLKGFDLGTELMFGKREIENGDSGDLTRLTVFAKYGF